MIPLTALIHMSSRRSLQIWLAAFLIFTLNISLPAPVSAAETNPEAAPPEPGTETVPADQDPPFMYGLEDRDDPFVPFLTEKATTSIVDMNEIVDTAGELTGMQLFEPGQLSLVALLKKNDQHVAMVEDVTGKGYMIEQGTKIGRRGVVKDIVPNKVVIEETAFTRAGKKIVTQIVMVLKKEGEE